ncbi:flagellar hook-basal body complex protein, partial [Pseudomonas sp. SIMBA_044]
TAFSSLVLPSTAGNYNSGGVQTSVRQSVTAQGDLSYTTSGTDLAISGDGFFIVQSPDGTSVLTRAGDFTKDKNGNLVN